MQCIVEGQHGIAAENDAVSGDVPRQPRCDGDGLGVGQFATTASGGVSSPSEAISASSSTSETTTSGSMPAWRSTRGLPADAGPRTTWVM